MQPKNAPISLRIFVRWQWRESNIIPYREPPSERKARPLPNALREVEMAGIEPASERNDPRKSTSVAG